MLAALERHQAAFLSEAAPNLIKSAPSGNRSEKRGRAPVPVKPVWEMTMDDLEDEEDDSGDEDSQDGDEIEVSITSTSEFVYLLKWALRADLTAWIIGGGSQRRVPEVAVFQDPSRASANVETSFYNFGDDTTPDQSAGTKKAMRDFMVSLTCASPIALLLTACFVACSHQRSRACIRRKVLQTPPMPSGNLRQRQHQLQASTQKKKREWRWPQV